MVTLDPLGLQDRGSEADGDIVGDPVTAQGQNGGVTDASLSVDGQIGSATAHVDQGYAELLVVMAQGALPRGQLLQDGVRHDESTPVDGGDNILSSRGRAGDNMAIHFQSGAQQPQRIADTVLTVDHKFLGKHMDDFTVRGQRHRPWPSPVLGEYRLCRFRGSRP